jgi:hypothetical protein
MVGARARRSALAIAIAVLALSFVADGVSDDVRTSNDPSAHVAAVQSGPPAPVPLLRRQMSGGEWRVRADRAGDRRGATLVALVWLVWLLGSQPSTVHRAPHPPWSGLAHRRHSISLRAPPAPCLT